MSQIPALKKIIVEDFPKQYQDLISKLAYPFNNAIETIISTVNGELSFDNFTWQYKSITFTVNADGSLPTSAAFSLSTTGQPLGMSVIKVVNNSSTAPLTSAPFAVYSIGNNNLVTFSQITGLAAGSNYTVNFIVYS
jgi:hypothetical protein